MRDYERDNAENRLAARIAVHNPGDNSVPTMVAFCDVDDDQIDISVNGSASGKELVERCVKQAAASTYRAATAVAEADFERMVQSVSTALEPFPLT